MSKKLIAFALAGIFALSMVAPVKADTISDLQAQITALMAQIAALQGQQSTGMTCFNTDLKLGMKSDDVKNLQIKLGVTPTSGYFGPITLAAVKSFQTAHGIINTGYVGKLTRGALNELYCVPPTTTPTTPPVTYPAGCTSAVGFSTTTGLPCSTTVTYPAGCTSAVGFSPTTGLSCAGTTTTTVGPSYGTLSVSTYPLSNPQTTLYGGATSELVAGQYKATGSDMTVRKVSVEIVDAMTTTFPWQVFSSISLWDGATKLGEVTLSEANMIKTTFAHDYTVDISGLNWVIPNGTQKVLTVKGTVVPNAVTAVTVAGQSYVVSLLASGVISTDTAGVTYTTAGSSNLSSSALHISGSNQGKATITLATDNPLAGNVIGSTSGTTRVDLLKFNVKVDDNNVTFNSGTITATSTYATTTVSVELWDGSTLITTAAPGTGGAVSWSNFTLPVSAGTTKTLTVKGVIAQLATGYNAGDSVSISTGPMLTGVDANSNVVTSTGSATGNAMKIYLVAPTFAYSTSNYTVSGSNPNGGKVNDLGSASITFTVTATGGDLYIATTTTGIVDNYTTGAGSPTSSDAWSCNYPAETNTNANFWRIPSGSTITCTFTDQLTNTAGVVGWFQPKIGHIKWATTAITTGAIDQIWGLTGLQTTQFYLGN